MNADDPLDFSKMSYSDAVHRFSVLLTPWQAFSRASPPLFFPLCDVLTQ